MIGIDLVDLEQARADSNWRRAGYLNKLFTTQEQVLIKDTETPEKMVWLLWSMKEAAYKSWSGESDNRRIYAPVKLICQLVKQEDNFISGMVSFLDQQYHTRSFLTQQYIYTLAASENTMLDKSEVSITTIHGTTGLYDKKNASTVSHHGKYLALAWLFPI